MQQRTNGLWSDEVRRTDRPTDGRKDDNDGDERGNGTGRFLMDPKRVIRGWNNIRHVKWNKYCTSVENVFIKKNCIRIVHRYRWRISDANIFQHVLIEQRRRETTRRHGPGHRWGMESRVVDGGGCNLVRGEGPLLCLCPLTLSL